MAGYTPVTSSAKLSGAEIMSMTLSAVGVTTMAAFAWLLGSPVPAWTYYTYISLYLLAMLTQIIAYGLNLE